MLKHPFVRISNLAQKKSRLLRIITLIGDTGIPVTGFNSCKITVRLSISAS